MLRRLPFAVPVVAVAAMIAAAGFALSSKSGIAQTPSPTQVTSNITPVVPTPVTTPVFTVPPPVFQQQPTGATGNIVYGNNSICGLPLYSASAGQTISDASGSVRVTLTEQGSYTYADRIVAGQTALSICHVPTNSTLVISIATGREITRSVRHGGAPDVFGKLLQTVQFMPGGSPAPGVQSPGVAPAGAISVGGIRPPSTGDAGLR